MARGGPSIAAADSLGGDHSRRGTTELSTARQAGERLSIL